MRRWLTLGALVLLGAWAPFLYAELTSERVSQKDSALAGDGFEQDTVDDVELAATAGEEPAAGAETDEPTGQGEPAVPPAEEDDEEPREAEQPEVPAQAPAAAPEHAAVEGTAPPEPGAQDEADEPQATPPAASPATVVLRQKFENEPRDALWAREAEAGLLQIFDVAKVPGSAIHATRCQKTVCKVELVWAPDYADAYMMAYQRVQEQFGHEIGVQPTGSGNYDDEMRVDLYVPRQGYSLADLAK